MQQRAAPLLLEEDNTESRATLGWVRLTPVLVAADPETKQSSPSTSWQAREDETELRIPGTFLAVPKSRSIFCTEKKNPPCFTAQSNSLETLWNGILCYVVCCQMIRTFLSSVFSGTQMENDVMDTACQNTNPHLNLHIRDILHLKCQTCKMDCLQKQGEHGLFWISDY